MYLPCVEDDKTKAKRKSRVNLQGTCITDIVNKQTSINRKYTLNCSVRQCVIKCVEIHWNDLLQLLDVRIL